MSETFRDRCEAWFESAIATSGKVNLKADAPLFADVVASDDDLLDAFIAECLTPAIQAIGERVIKRHRATVHRSGDVAMTRERLRAEIHQAATSATTTWLAPSATEPVAIMQLTKVEVNRLANQHAGQALEHAATARWLHAVSVRMTDRDRVQDVLSLDQLRLMQQNALEDQTAVSYGKPRRIA